MRKNFFSKKSVGYEEREEIDFENKFSWFCCFCWFKSGQQRGLTKSLKQGK